MSEQYPQAAPLITRAAHPALRREVPAVVAAAVRDARERQTRAGSTTVRRTDPVRPGPIVPANLSALLGVSSRQPADPQARPNEAPGH
ncbi:hypothetical protein [Nakamurella lactea]|jgi:hypothetical protein|uniref:hypothetical protein n=1 Tax=Nakamurella lactea TaxID=459515 RepID=UPI00042A3F96|nr:hypothetical protein [Nakamurella lactea]